MTNRTPSRSRTAVACVMLVFGFTTIAQAELYRSKSLPPDDLILKTASTTWEFSRGYSIAGKFVLSDSAYEVYICKVKDCEILTLKRLDTNVWFLQFNGFKPMPIDQ